MFLERLEPGTPKLFLFFSNFCREQKQNGSRCRFSLVVIDGESNRARIFEP
jgi:hypothetical protein